MAIGDITPSPEQPGMFVVEIENGRQSEPLTAEVAEELSDKVQREVSGRLAQQAHHLAQQRNWGR